MKQAFGDAPDRQRRIDDGPCLNTLTSRVVSVLLVTADKKRQPHRRHAPEVSVRCSAVCMEFACVSAEPAFDGIIADVGSDFTARWHPPRAPTRQTRRALQYLQ